MKCHQMILVLSDAMMQETLTTTMFMGELTDIQPQLQLPDTI